MGVDWFHLFIIFLISQGAVRKVRNARGEGSEKVWRFVTEEESKSMWRNTLKKFNTYET